MNIYLIRHGKTLGNEQELVQGWIGGELSETGIKQANEATKDIGQISPDIIISSDLSRCAQTAKLLDPGGVQILHDWRLRERYFGDLEGGSSEGISWLDFWTRDEDYSEHGEETTASIYSRALDFVRSLHFISKKYQTVLIVTHGGMINVLKTIESGPSYTPKSYDNCEITQIDYGKIVQST